MVKVILAVDDYNESFACQSLLKKLGFDVFSITKDAQFNSTVLGFLPDIVIASFKTKNVDGINVGIEARKVVSHPRILLLYTTANEPVVAQSSKIYYDFLLQSPFDYEELLGCVAEMARVDHKSLYEKYLKLKIPRVNGQGTMTVFGGKDITNATSPIVSTMSSELRSQRYNDFLKRSANEETPKVIDRKAMNQKLQDFEEKNRAELASSAAINDQKLEFAKALFRK